ncbi:MAG TPA: hypothetical protein VN962_20185 [Polyangia bacterium]|nr:hypothetical protein [Polyangia bacterium]
MTTAPVEVVGLGRRASRVVLFVALAALTAAEVALVLRDGDARLQTTALCGLLLMKAGLLLAYSLRATPRRPGPRLALVALVTAVGFAVVLMLEAAYRAGVR